MATNKNFWVTVAADGRKTTTSTGPKGNGGMTIRLNVKEHGESVEALQIHCKVLRRPVGMDKYETTGLEIWGLHDGHEVFSWVYDPEPEAEDESEFKEKSIAELVEEYEPKVWQDLD